MNNTTKIALPLLVLLAFAAFSIWVVEADGLLGFIPLAGREPWALQMLLDLAIAMTMFAVWMVPDARARGIAAWPYLVLLYGAGSLGALAYLVHRGLAERRPAATPVRA